MIMLMIIVVIIFIITYTFIYFDIKRRIDKIEPVDNLDTPFQKRVVYQEKIDYDTINAIMNIIEKQDDLSVLTLFIWRKKQGETLYTSIDIKSSIEMSYNDIEIQKVKISRYKKLKKLYGR